MQRSLDMVLEGSALDLQNSSEIFNCSGRPSVLAFSWASDVVDLQDHLDHLSGQQDLLLLANQGLNHMLLFHVWKWKNQNTQHLISNCLALT